MNDIGKKYGQLTIIKYAGFFITSNRNKIKKVFCQCKCGNTIEVNLNNLKTGNTKSCGCLLKRGNNYKHGLTNHPLYQVLDNIKQRCYNKKNRQYKDYGGRGITVCQEWLNDFKVFYDWSMHNGYKKGLRIDRRGNDGNYEPGNCRFVTCQVNNLNKRHPKIYADKKCTSEFRGVGWHRKDKKWQVSISINGKMKYLGSFDSEILAALRWDAEAFITDNRLRNF